VNFTNTKRGCLRAEFKDRFGQECSIQEATTPGENCLWVGVETDINGDWVDHGRMIVDQALARKLIPLLRHFIRKGTLGMDEPTDHFQVGSWVVGVGEENKGVEGRIIQVQKGVSMVVQDHMRPGESGQHACLWEVVDLIWVPCEVPDHIPTRYERLTNEED
jgi:hypothetical protein